MKIFALSDPHLSRGLPGKEQDIFGPQWVRHDEKIEENWRRLVGPQDLVLIPGDISWAMRPQEALPDLHFLDRLPGVKVLIKGNHDYWWSTLAKTRRLLPPSLRAVGGDAIGIEGVGVCGTRLWDAPGISFDELSAAGAGAAESAVKNQPKNSPEESEKIFQREVRRLERSLAALDDLSQKQTLSVRIALTHYPPCDATISPSPLTELFEKRRVRHVVFGHLHNLRPDLDPPPFGRRGGVTYHLCSCDYIDFTPVLLDEV